ncbi:TraR/DksA family transcriptional regulator [Hoeflea marina]|uniref:TraR/DksA family transcriptional regulator n=1 Tax=Hoeflea marina TaxID=274592 RepID=A0A317PG00_9HYPH|nr:TraR/DksA C4-type zinc finger protein [Hoeflea marina]PWV97724.1 TraR/DksA family transcriptional regulator [Hoeflea marina]
MSNTDFMIEQAEERVARERDRKLGQVALQVAAKGLIECRDCGTQIPSERRSAAPFAERCIECQQSFERNR